MAPARDPQHASALPQAIAVEYYNPSLNHYFITAEPAEAAMLDAGVVVPGWQRTDYEFKVYPSGRRYGLPACRFFGTPPLGPELALLHDRRRRMREGEGESAVDVRRDSRSRPTRPAAGDCPADRIPVIRLYNNGMGGQANHRFTTSRSRPARDAGGGLDRRRARCSAGCPDDLRATLVHRHVPIHMSSHAPSPVSSRRSDVLHRNPSGPAHVDEIARQRHHLARPQLAQPALDGVVGGNRVHLRRVRDRVRRRQREGRPSRAAASRRSGPSARTAAARRPACPTWRPSRGRGRAARDWRRRRRGRFPCAARAP